MNPRPQILVVDDEKEVCTFFLHLFKADYDITVAYSGAEVERLISEKIFDLAFVDLKLTDSDGLTLLNMINEKIPHCSVIIMTGYSTVNSAVQAIRQGAFNYIEKPFDDLNYLKKMANDALGRGEEGFSGGGSCADGFVTGTNPVMQNLISMARKVADKKLTVLIEGETGTGKEVLARFIHRHSNRAAYPFLAVNCGAFTETLLESELFGHEKGSFTGALSTRRGIFEMANNGTLFLDEIGESSTATQVKLLRILENDEFYRIGGERPYRCDVRLIAATNSDLTDAIRQGRFREDLYYRLNVINLKLPPLRERKEDIPLFVEYLLKGKFQKYHTRFSQEALDLLMSYHWPGNVRELVNVISQVLALCDGREITQAYFPEKISRQGFTKSAESLREGLADAGKSYFQDQNLTGGIDLSIVLDEIKTAGTDVVRMVINRVLEQTGGHQGRAAELLNISSRQLQYYLKEK